MTMKAKALPGIGTIFAFGGIPFTVGEWHDVPAGHEEEARNHPYLDIKETSDSDVVEEKVMASDAARDLAEGLGVDLGMVIGTGKDGAITVKDVRKAAKAKFDLTLEDWNTLPPEMEV